MSSEVVPMAPPRRCESFPAPGASNGASANPGRLPVLLAPFYYKLPFSTFGGVSSPNGYADQPRHVLAIYFDVVKVFVGLIFV